MVGGGLSLKKSIALTFKLLKKSKSENENRAWYPAPSIPIPFIARHPSEIDYYTDPRSLDKLKFTSFLGDPPPEPPLSPIEATNHASVSQYLSAIRELNGRREPVFIFSEQPLDSNELIEEAQKSIEFSNPIYQSLAECLSGLSPELEEERMKLDGDSVHYQVVVSNMPVYLDQKIYANLDKEIHDEPLYAVSDVMKDPDEIYANIELPIEPIINNTKRPLESEVFDETVLYCTIPEKVKASDNIDTTNSETRTESEIIQQNNLIITDDKSVELQSLITNKAAKTAFMQKLDNQLRSQIKKRVQFAVPEYTAYTLEPFPSIETKQASLPQEAEGESLKDSVVESISEVEQVSASLLLEMLESVPELPKPAFRISEAAPPLPTSAPPHKGISGMIPSLPEKLNVDEEVVDAVNEVDFRIPKDVSTAEQVTESEVIYLEPEVTKPESNDSASGVESGTVQPVSGIFRASVVELSYVSDDGATPVKKVSREERENDDVAVELDGPTPVQTPVKKNIGEIIAEEKEKAIKRKLEMLPDKPEVTVYDLGVSQVEKERNKLIRQQKVKVKKMEDWVSQDRTSQDQGVRNQALVRSSAIPESLKPKGWKSPERKAIKSPLGEVISDSIIQQKDDTKKFWENKMISAMSQEEALSPPPGFDDVRAETPMSQTSSGSIPLVDVPDDSFISVGELLPEEEPKKAYMYHDAGEDHIERMENDKTFSSFVETDSLIEIAKSTNNPTETFIEREIRLQKERERQIQAEREVAMKNSSVSNKPQGVTSTKNIRSISKPSLEFPRSEKHKTADALISQEIEDYKRREEELRWRQSSNLQGSRENLLEDQFASMTTTDEGHYSDNDAASEERESRGETPLNNLQKSQSLESLSSGHSSGDVTTYQSANTIVDTKRRRVVVKPFDDAEEEPKVPAFLREQKETPIEREIRLAKEREEELRKNRTASGLPVWATQQTKKPEVTKVAKEIPRDGNRGVQQRLATSRIQAEINEITEKEKELRSAGKIQTTSEETVDSKVQRLSHLAEYSAELQQAREAKRGQLSRAVSTPQLNIEPDHPRVPLTRGLSTQAPTQKQPLGIKKTVAPPAGTTQRGLMQKFINSRGKSANLSSPEPVEPVVLKSAPVKTSHVLNPAVVDKLVVKEVQEPAIPPTAVTQKPPAPRRHFLTAEEKIQEEMKEMQRREEELRLQRMKHLTRSQPDLNGFDDGEPSTPDQQSLDSVDHEINHNDTDLVTRRPSHAVNAITTAAKNQRRKSHLIAEWENRIQQN